MGKNKLIRVLIVIISIINIIFLVYGYNTNIEGNHSFNQSLSPSTYNNNMFSILVLIIQVLNIVLSIAFSKISLIKQKRYLILMIVLIIITAFIPVSGISSVKYELPTGKFDFGSTTYRSTYKNLYGITLTNSERKSGGIDYY